MATNVKPNHPQATGVVVGSEAMASESVDALYSFFGRAGASSALLSIFFAAVMSRDHGDRRPEQLAVAEAQLSCLTGAPVSVALVRAFLLAPVQ